MKGIILAGGTGSRLFPSTLVVSKQLLPVYDKPMIYYPLCTLLQAGIREILIITTPHERDLFEKLLGNGKNWGISITYATQAEPRGLADAFIIGADFIGHERVALCLGDNILYGDNLIERLHKAAKQNDGATIFGYYVANPERYGVIEFDTDNNPSQIIEKPREFISNYAVIGLYFYDSQVVDIAKSLQPSARGELEISDINQHYLNTRQLHVEKLGRGIAWLDTGTHKSLLDASHFISVLEERQGIKIGCPEEIAWRLGYINENQLIKLANKQMNSGYGEYLLHLLQTTRNINETT